MLVSIGRRNAPEDLVGLLLECHERIRAFIRLAEDIGRRDDLTVSDVVDGCRRCERYFSEALPLHVEDEESSLFPRLRGASREVDDALVRMQSEHDEHGPKLRLLVDSLRSVALDPSDRLERRTLRLAASRLALDFEQHLTLEEQVIFPAIRSVLSSQAQAAIVDELRARRHGSFT